MRRRAIGPIHLDRGLALPDEPAIEHPDAPRQPTVSIITSTYNRSNVLRLLIESIRAQTFTDWEMVIVGDHCTDDTADVIRGFDDPRIRYYDLDANHGEQSGPNSIGARLARGRYVAWINHDELLYSDHLEQLIEVATSRSADLVMCSLFVVGPRDMPHSQPDAESADDRTTVGRVDRVSGIRGLLDQPASSWLVRATIVERVGDWRSASELRAHSSLQYLHRCWMTGARTAHAPRPTLVAIQSGRFTNSYRDRREREHVALASDVIGRRSDEDPFPWPVTHVVPAPLRRRSPRRLLTTPMIWALARLGRAPSEVLAVVTLRRRGEFIRRLRSRRGLD